DRIEVREQICPRAHTGGIRHPERGNAELVLGAHVKRRPACDEDLQPRRRLQELGDDRSRLEDLLEIVEEKQGLPIAKGVLERFRDRSTWLLADAYRSGDGRMDQTRVRDRRERDEGDSL